MKRNLVLVGIVFVLGLAGRADAAPGIRIDPGPFAGNGMLFDGGAPGEPQFGYYQITNTGTTVLHLKEMAFTGANAGHIAYDDGLCGEATACARKIDVPAGGQVFFSVRCVAPAGGAFPATLEVKSNAHDVATTLTCKGLHPPVIQVSPSGLDFGTAHGCWFGDACGPRCNTQPATQTLTITNAAPAPSEVDLAAALPHDGPSWDFTIDADQQQPFVLSAGQSVNVTFTFHPMSPNGTDTYNGLTITPVYPTGLAPIAVPFHAHKGWGQLVFDTPPLLGTVAVGDTLTTAITVHNAGDSCLDILGVNSEQDLALLGPGTGQLLAAGASRSVPVSCTAPGVNGGAGFLDFDLYNDDPEFQSAQFFCQPVGAGLWTSPSEIDFDSYGVPVGSSGTAQVTVFNPGDAATTLVAMTPSDPRYSVALDSGTLPVSLAPGAELTLDVTFTPTDTERVTGTILLDASVGSDYHLPVFGSGVTGLAAPRIRAPADPIGPAGGGGCAAGGTGSLASALALLVLRRRRPR